MKKRYDEGGYIPKSIFNQEGTPIADVGESRFMTESSPSEPESASESASESAPKAKKKPKAARKPKPKSEPMQSFIAPKKEMKQISSSEAKPRSKLDPYGVIEGAANKVKGAASDIGDALSKPFRAIREAGNRDNPDAPKKMASGGKVSSASSRGDGCATKGKTKGRFV
jgi:hypothetical protein